MMESAAYKVERYTADRQALWDSFVDNSRNGTFLHKRGYMDYHAHRFTDHSLMFYRGEDLVAIMPAFAMKLGINNQFAQFYGGTSLLILVGVVLDTLQQIESYLLMRHYDGLMKTGRLKGRSGM